MSNKFANLYQEPSNIREVMAGPWNDIRIDTLHEGQTLTLESDELEHSLFFLSGTATVTNSDGTKFALQKNSALALPAHGRIDIECTSETVELLHVEMRIDG
ncbi:hypothetical protein [Rhodococcus gannanensis]|uniref:Uncharacterized protein n=1 Tax=Rhodococcus gannanensis TaxID=1960308 RepID=A0ABW4NZM4_9NOCA